MNNKNFLKEVLKFLEENSINTWVFGGWAEEILEIAPPKDHKDIDLFYPAQNFTLFDKLLANTKELQEIKSKRFSHKRAFLYKGVMIEIFLVQTDKGKYYTDFWGEKKYYWPANLLGRKRDSLNVVCEASLMAYRKDYKTLHNDIRL